MFDEEAFFARIILEIDRQYATATAFADTVGIPMTTLYTVLHKSRLRASFDTIVRICDVLGIDIDSFRTAPVSEQERLSLQERYLASPDMRPAVRKLLEIDHKE